MIKDDREAAALRRSASVKGITTKPQSPEMRLYYVRSSLALRMTQNTHPNIAGSPWAADSICRTRSELLDRLASTLEKLGRAKLNLRASLEEQGDDFFEPATPIDVVTNQLEQLRSDCGSIRTELEYHRAAHGC